MKKHFLSICIGILIGLVAGSATGAFAAVGTKIEATFDKFNFVVNGKKEELPTDPIVYKGTTYLPVRVVGNMLGYDVNFKSKDKTIEMVNGSGAAPMDIDTNEIERELKLVNDSLETQRKSYGNAKQSIDPMIKSRLDDGYTMEQIENESLLGNSISPLPQLIKELKQSEEGIKKLETRKGELEKQLEALK